MAKQKLIKCAGKCGLEHKEGVLVGGICPECLADRDARIKKAKEDEDKRLIEMNELLSSKEFLSLKTTEEKINKITKVPFPFPAGIHKPKYSGDGSSVSYRLFSEALEKYEIENDLREREYARYSAEESKRRRWFRKWCIAECLPANLPEKQKDKAYQIALERGESAGLYEVYVILSNLAEIFVD